MDNKPSFDRGLLIPIGVGIFSLIGLCVILVAGRITALRGNIQEVPTMTAFKYALVGTEPAITTVTLEPVGFDTPAATQAPEVFITSTRVAVSTPIILTSNVTSALSRTPLTTASPVPNTLTPTRTPTSQSTDALRGATFDDTDYRLVYSGDWTMQSDVPGANQNTLHVSGTSGTANTVVFRFIGTEIRIFFQAGPSLGTIRLELDGADYDMNESNSSTQTYEWVLPSVSNGTHNVTISHLSGGSVNLDYIIVPEVPATPTKTATSTSP